MVLGCSVETMCNLLCGSVDVSSKCHCGVVLLTCVRQCLAPWCETLIVLCVCLCGWGKRSWVKKVKKTFYHFCLFLLRKVGKENTR